MDKEIIKGRRGLFHLRRYSSRNRRAIGIALIGLGIFTFVLAVRTFYLNQQFAGSTVKVIGSVKALFPGSPWWERHGHAPRVVYRYPVGTFEVWTSRWVRGSTFDSLSIGASLPVQYLPNYPTTNRIDLPAEQADERNRPYWLTAFSILIVVGGTYIAIKARRDQRTNHPHRSLQALDV